MKKLRDLEKRKIKNASSHLKAAGNDLFSLFRPYFQKALSFRKYINWRNAEICAVGLLVFAMIFRFVSGLEKEEPVEEQKAKTVELLTFGKWSPDGEREILATIESAGDIEIKSDIAGTIDEVSVEIGEEVKEGQILAKFRLQNDSTQVTYENALRNLQAVRASSQNTIRSAEITLETAERETGQTTLTQEQTKKQVFEKLRTTAVNSETIASSALDWADRILGASNRFQYREDAEDLLRQHVGSNNRVKREEIKNELLKLLDQKAQFPSMPSFRPADKDFLSFAKARLDFLRAMREVVRDLDVLVRETSLSVRYSFTETARAALEAEVESYSESLDSELLALESQIETAKTQEENKGLSILTAENKAENARASLELAKATAESNLAIAENAFRTAQAGQSDLEVQAPFSGKITAKYISNFQQVKVGDELFSLMAKEITPRITAYVTSEEWQKISSSEEIKIKLSGGEILSVKTPSLSSKADSASQKIRVEFPLEEFPEGSFVGNFARVILPSMAGEETNLVPISAVSFEPDGAEVLVVENKGLAERRKIEYARIMGDGIEISSGLTTGEQVVKYRSRAHAGERISGELRMKNEEKEKVERKME